VALLELLHLCVSKNVIVTPRRFRFLYFMVTVGATFAALSASSSFSQLLLQEEIIETIAQTVAYDVPPASEAKTGAAAAPYRLKDVRTTLRLDKAGPLSSVSIVVGLINQRLLQKLGSTFLEAVWFGNKEKEFVLAEMVDAHIESELELMRGCVFVGSMRRAVRMILCAG